MLTSNSFLKINFENVTKRFQTPLSLKELSEVIYNSFEIDNFNAYYVDYENEMILIANEYDYVQALEYSKRITNSLKLIIKVKEYCSKPILEHYSFTKSQRKGSSLFKIIKLEKLRKMFLMKRFFQKWFGKMVMIKLKERYNLYLKKASERSEILERREEVIHNLNKRYALRKIILKPSFNIRKCLGILIRNSRIKALKTAFENIIEFSNYKIYNESARKISLPKAYLLKKEIRNNCFIKRINALKRFILKRSLKLGFLKFRKCLNPYSFVKKISNLLNRFSSSLKQGLYMINDKLLLISKLKDIIGKNHRLRKVLIKWNLNIKCLILKKIILKQVFMKWKQYNEYNNKKNAFIKIKDHIKENYINDFINKFNGEKCCSDSSYKITVCRECTTCNRKFNLYSFDKHFKYCEKVFIKKRNGFNSKKQRIINKEHENLLNKYENTERTNFVKSEKNSKWRKLSKKFRAIMRINRLLYSERI